MLSRFLCLARNRIQRVENLQALPQLSSLDLSRNLIQVLDTGEGQERIQELWDSHSHLPCLSFPARGDEVLLPEERGGVFGGAGILGLPAQPFCVSFFSLFRGAAPQPQDPRPDRERVHLAGWIQVGQEGQEREKTPQKTWEKLGVT